jgi:hypothetical protein
MTCMMCRQVQCTRSVLQRAVSKEYAVFRYSMTRDVQETKGEATAWSMGRESRAETRERAERELRKRSERAATRERQWREAREREAVSPAASRRYQEEEVTKEEVEGRTVSSITARCRRTGLGTRGMRIRHYPHGGVSQGTIVRGPSDHEHLGRSSTW